MKFKIFLCIAFSVFFVIPARAYKIAVKSEDPFQRIKLLSPAQRADTALYIYKSNYRKVPETVAMKKLDDLLMLARSLDDQLLECTVYEMRADYYSVNDGFNNKSISYYNQAITYAIKHNLKIEQGEYIHKKAIYYSIFKHNTTACSYFLDAQEIFEQIGYNNVPEIGMYLWEFSEFYYGIGDYDECREYLLQALKYNVHSLRNRINMTNTIGLIHRNRNEFPQALSVFNHVLLMATAGKDTAWIGIANGNIGSVYFMQNQYAKALPYIEADYRISLKCQEYLNAAIDLLRLARISLETNQLKEAELQLITVEFLLGEDKTSPLKYQADLYNLKAVLFERTNNLKQALLFRKKFEITKDSMIRQDNITAVDRVSLQWEKDKHILQLNQLKANAQISAIKLGGIIIILVLLMAFYAFRYRRKILEAKKDKEILLSEKSNVDEELKAATSALILYTENLKIKNETIEQFKKKIEHMQAHLSDKTEIEKLDKLMQTHIMTDESWTDFKKLFSKVHSLFFYNLAKNFPGLSVTDTRLLALIKLGLSNHEMANMLGITVEGIKKAKQRLRKKIHLSPDEDIETVIAQF